MPQPECWLSPFSEFAAVHDAKSSYSLEGAKSLGPTAVGVEQELLQISFRFDHIGNVVPSNPDIRVGINQKPKIHIALKTN